MTGAGRRKSALLATLATAAACCLGSSNVHALAAAPGADGPAAGAYGPAVEAGPVTAPLRQAGRRHRR